MEGRSPNYLQGGLGFRLDPLPPLLSDNSVFLSYLKAMGDSNVFSFDHLLKDPRFLEKVAEGTENPDSAQLRFAAERLTLDFVNKELCDILGLARFGPGRPNLDDLGAEDRLEGAYGKIFKIIPSEEPHPITRVKDGKTYEDWKGSNLSIKLLTFSSKLPEYRQCARFVRESIIWSKMRHRNIAPILGLWHDFNTSFSKLPGLVSPWFEEGDLSNYIASDTPDDFQNVTGKYTPIKQRLYLLHEVMTALRYLHTQQIKVVHGDVKTNNILIKDGHAYICDFGLSRILGTITGLSSSSTTNNFWLAPERYEGDNVKATPKSDVYEFGVTFWHVVTGKNPVNHTKKVTIRRELSRPENIPDKVWAFLQSCLDYNPSSRIDSIAADDFLRDLVERGIDWSLPMY